MEFTQHYWSLYVLLFWMVCIIFVLYLIINCIIWAVVILLHHKKLKILLFGKRFLLINLIWFILILLAAFILRKNIALLAVNPSAALPLVICSVIISYFMLLSYPLIVHNSVFVSLRKTFTFGITKFPRIGLMYVYCIATILIADALLRIMGNISPIAMFIGGIILVLPIFALIRIFINETILYIE
jgi:hypothetical protein